MRGGDVRLALSVNTLHPLTQPSLALRPLRVFLCLVAVDEVLRFLPRAEHRANALVSV